MPPSAVIPTRTVAGHNQFRPEKKSDANTSIIFAKRFVIATDEFAEPGRHRITVDWNKRILRVTPGQFLADLTADFI